MRSVASSSPRRSSERERSPGGSAEGQGRRRRGRQTAIGWSTHRDGRPLFLGWGAHLTRAQKDRLRSRIALVLLTMAIVAVIGMLSGGILYENVYLPRLSVVRAGTDAVSLTDYAKRLAFERNRLLLQAQNARAQIERQRARADGEGQEAIINLLQQQYNFMLERVIDLPEQLQDDLVAELLIGAEARRRGLTATETEIDTQIKRIIGYPLPTPTPGPTATPNSIATANAQATGTAAAGSLSEATPTVVQTPTAASTPAVTATPEGTAADAATTVGAATTATGTTDVPSPTATPAGPTPTPAPTATPLPFPTYFARYQEVVGSDTALIRSVAKARVLRAKLNEALGEVPTAQEQVRARHILVADEAAAQTVVERLEAGEDFAALATELSTDNSTKEAAGDLGFFPRGIMVPEFEATAFSLTAGETSPPIETQFGYHVIRVEEREEQREIPDYQLQQIRANAINRWLDEQLTTAQIKRRLDDRLIEWAERQSIQ